MHGGKRTLYLCFPTGGSRHQHHSKISWLSGRCFNSKFTSTPMKSRFWPVIWWSQAGNLPIISSHRSLPLYDYPFQVEWVLVFRCAILYLNQPFWDKKKALIVIRLCINMEINLFTEEEKTWVGFLKPYVFP
jgi:hypothetical protein